MSRSGTSSAYPKPTAEQAQVWDKEAAWIISNSKKPEDLRYGMYCLMRQLNNRARKSEAYANYMVREHPEVVTTAYDNQPPVVSSAVAFKSVRAYVLKNKSEWLSAVSNGSGVSLDAIITDIINGELLQKEQAKPVSPRQSAAMGEDVIGLRKQLETINALRSGQNDSKQAQ